MTNDKFIAIGVGRGDAFFLQRKEVAILVDGGRAVLSFPNQFQRVTNSDSIDVAVCTHNDADHACGILGLLEQGFPVKEVWLPEIWADRLADLLQNPIEFFDEVLANIHQVNNDEMPEELPNQELVVFGDRLSRLYRVEGNEAGERASISADQLFAELFEHIESAEYYEWMQISGGMVKIDDWFYFFPFLPRGATTWRLRLMIQALAAADRIRRIAIAAYHQGVKIRWFAYDRNQNGGGESGILEPVNAVEVLQIRASQFRALYYLALTTSNKESMVLYSPPSNRAPAVLFSADSGFSFNQPLQSSPSMIITAPHHGSESNAVAYQRVRKGLVNFHDSTWVRSDGRFSKNPGASFLDLVEQRRCCTICRESPTQFSSKQSVRFSGMRAGFAKPPSTTWRRDPETHLCRCS